MRVLRHHLAGASVAAMLLAGGGPAAAATTAATIDGALWIGCYGCASYGPAGNAASFTITGSYDGTVLVRTPATMSFAVSSPPGVTCAVSSTAAGTLTVGNDTRSAGWTALGAYASIFVSKAGTSPIQGDAVFAVSDPVACGRAVAVRVLGTLYAA